MRLLLQRECPAGAAACHEVAFGLGGRTDGVRGWMCNYGCRNEPETAAGVCLVPGA